MNDWIGLEKKRVEEYLGLIAKDVRVKADIVNEEVHMTLQAKKKER